MPGKMNPRDWDRLFHPNAPKRGGPLWALGNVLFAGVTVAVFAVGITFALQAATIYQERQAEQTTAQVVAETTRTARAESTQIARVADATATAEARLQGGLGVGSVIVPGGNLRSEPVVADNTVVGQICRDDQVVILEEQTTDTGVWYRIRLTGLGENCDAPQRLDVNAEGWASGSLLSEPGPLPAEAPEPEPAAGAPELEPAAEAPQPEPAAAVPPGALTQHDTNNFTIGLPTNWEVFELTSAEERAVLDELVAQNPQLQSIAQNPDAIDAAELWAINVEKIGVSFAESVNIRRAPLGSANVNIQFFVRMMEAQYRQAGIDIIESQADLTINDRPAAKIRSAIQLQMDAATNMTFESHQYLIVEGSDAWVLSYGIASDQVADLMPLIEQSAYSFQLRQ